MCEAHHPLFTVEIDIYIIQSKHKYYKDKPL